MITKTIQAFNKQLIIGCDAKCEKAFGYNGRPFEQISDDENDICWLTDDEVGIAPVSGETVIIAEGTDSKPNPAIPETLLNKWCFRECERSVCCEKGEAFPPLPDFSKRKYNKSRI